MATDNREALRNDPELKKTISENLEKKAQQAERLIQLLDEMSTVLSDGNLWTDTDIGFQVFKSQQLLKWHSPDKLRIMAHNDTYLGNCAVFGNRF